jgi:transposase
MSKAHRDDPKEEALRELGCLNPRPQDVSEEMFGTDAFFDARDRLQVKYEMLRRVAHDGHAVARVAQAFGFSRPAFYLVQAAFRRDGLPGLAPRKRGPHQAHKLTPEVIAFLGEQKQQNPTLRAPALAHRVLQRFGMTIHPRTIERALGSKQKKTAPPA